MAKTRPDNADAILARLLPKVAATSSETLVVTSPLDGHTICEIPVSSVHDVEQAFAHARGAFVSWSKTSLDDRLAIINRFHNLILENQEMLADIIQWENGKSRINAMDEIFDVVITSRYYLRTAKKILRPKRRRGAFPLVTLTREYFHPRGVIGVVSPWNFPLTLAVSDYLPALIAGNTVVTKPDHQTPLSALAILDLLLQAGLPPGVVHVLIGEGHVTGPEVIERADYVMFTGSTRVGREVASRAGARLVDASLELGGKNSLIVGKKIDVEHAVAMAARGAFAHAGQVCIGTERVLVHVDMYEEFMEKFTMKVAGLRVGSEIGWGNQIGVLINQRQIETCERHIADAVAKGAKVEVGGHRLPEIGPNAFAPTVLSHVPLNAEICSTETFGPVCAVYTWRTDEDLVAFVNNTEYGLSAGIVSSDVDWAEKIAVQLKVGGVNINESFGSAYGSIDAPMGGMGQSGVGRRHGVGGLLKYTETQTVARQRWMRLEPQWKFDDKAFVHFITVVMRVLKVLRFK